MFGGPAAFRLRDRGSLANFLANFQENTGERTGWVVEKSTRATADYVRR
jgi:hypothetical protein